MKGARRGRCCLLPRLPGLHSPELAPLMWRPAAACGRFSPTAPHRDFPGGGETQHTTHDFSSACQAPAHSGSRGTPGCRSPSGAGASQQAQRRKAPGRVKGERAPLVDGQSSEVVTPVCKSHVEPEIKQWQQSGGLVPQGHEGEGGRDRAGSVPLLAPWCAASPPACRDWLWVPGMQQTRLSLILVGPWVTYFTAQKQNKNAGHTGYWKGHFQGTCELRVPPPLCLAPLSRTRLPYY